APCRPFPSRRPPPDRAEPASARPLRHEIRPRHLGVLTPRNFLMLVSIVIPCHNEAAVLPETLRRLSEVADRLKSEAAFEFIFVDDGSRDDTARLLHELADADSRVRGLRLSRNFGQQIATTAGLENAAGDAVVV